MRPKSITAALALILISSLAAPGWADASRPTKDPIGVVRSYLAAKQADGNWRGYLSKRWQTVVTPTIMDEYNLHERNRKERDKNRPDGATPLLKDVTLVQATDDTAVVAYVLTLIRPDGNTDTTYREYLIKEDGRWMIDTICISMRPQWAMPADLKPIYDGVSAILQQEQHAFFDAQGKARHDLNAIEVFAMKNFAEQSLGIGVRDYAESCEAKSVPDSMRVLSSMIIDITQTRTVDKIPYASVSTGQLVAKTNDNGETEAAINIVSSNFVNEFGQWKLLVSDR